MVYDTRRPFTPLAINHSRLTGGLSLRGWFYANNPISKSFITVFQHFHGVFIETMKTTCKLWIHMYTKIYGPWRNIKTLLRGVTVEKLFGAIIRKGRSMQFPNHSFNRFMLLSQTIVFLIDRLFFIIWLLDLL